MNYILIALVALLIVMVGMLLVKSNNTPQVGGVATNELDEKWYNEDKLSNQENRDRGIKLAEKQDSLTRQIQILEKELNTMKESQNDSQQRQMAKIESMAKVMTDKKSRGRYGEVMLEQILTDAYGVQSEIVLKQHKLDKGGLVDIALKISDKGLLPIDSKFPMEYYMRWVETNGEMERKDFLDQIKVHVKKIAGYIDVSQTTPYALMFVPSEAVFAEIQTDNALLEFSQKQKVYFASPTTLLAVVTVAAQINLERDRVKNLPKLLKELGILQKHISTYQTSWEKVEKAIANASAHAATHTNAVNNFGNKAESVLNSRDAQKLINEEE